MLKHYLLTALLNLRRAPVVTLINVLALALGIATFVTAYAVAAFWGSADRQFANSNRTYVLTINATIRGFDFSFENEPQVPPQMARYLKNELPQIETIARATVVSKAAMVSTGARAMRLFGAAADSEFLRIFDLPFVAGDPEHALDAPRSVVLTKEYATKLFGSENPLGKTLRFANSIDTTVTGVVDAITEPSHMGRSVWRCSSSTCWRATTSPKPCAISGDRRGRRTRRHRPRIGSTLPMSPTCSCRKTERSRRQPCGQISRLSPTGASPSSSARYRRPASMPCPSPHCWGCTRSISSCCREPKYR